MRGLGCGGKMSESEAWKVEERCRKARFGVGVSRKGVGKRGLELECRGKVSESGGWSVTKGCQKAGF